MGAGQERGSASRIREVDAAAAGSAAMREYPGPDVPALFTQELPGGRAGRQAYAKLMGRAAATRGSFGLIEMGYSSIHGAPW